MMTNRKIILIFVLAIFLPSLIVGYLSFTTFSRRRETVDKLLESNLYISGEAALNSVESALLDHEQEALKKENFVRLSRSLKTRQPLFNTSSFIEDSSGQHFLLDCDYQIVFPKTGRESESIFQWESLSSESPFAQRFREAESYEFSRENIARAVVLYRECTSTAPSEQLNAISLEGLGRCLLSLKRYDEAWEIYNELSTDYGEFQNRAGHPYGIAAAFQLYEINWIQQKKKTSLAILLDLYKKLRDGEWLLNPSTYHFFTKEIESILTNRFDEGEFLEIQKSFQNIQSQKSPYGEALVFVDFLERSVIPKIEEKISFTHVSGNVSLGRLLVPRNEDFYLISYTPLPDFVSTRTYYGGLFWNLDFIKHRIIPETLKDITKDSKLLFYIVDEKGRDILTDEEDLTSKPSFSLAYRQFPLPWKLIVSNPETQTLERTARREIFFYGFLLTFIVVLMLLGAVLIVRDISRESETTRLKTEFVHNISHELKTPLTLIRLYGETLQRKENLSNKEKKESYEIITKESERLSHLINNVLDFSRIEMGRKEFHRKRSNLAHTIQDTLESYRYHLEKKGFVVHSDIASDLPEMEIDEEAIASVLVNLLSNVMKFSPKNKEIQVKLYHDNNDVTLQVVDQGIGISEKEISKIFQRFYRSRDDVVSETSGSGLGLPLVKHIVEAHGGRVEVESEVGMGSTFSVILPFSGTKKD